MPEGVAEVPNGGAPASDGAGKPDVTPNSGQPQNTPVSGAKPEQKSGEDARVAGLMADLKKERADRQKYEREVAARQAELEIERRRVHALSGITPQSDDDVEDAAVKAALKKRFPHLAELTAEDVKAIRDFKARSESLQATTEHYWDRHAQTMVSKAQGLVAKEIGGTLSDRQKARLEAAYINEAGRNPEFLKRHESGDETLLDEFAKQWVEDWFEPARRKVTQNEVQRLRPVPSGKDRGIVTHGQQKIDVNDSKQVEDLLVQSFKERGGTFGRR